jgi:hypothetical protein
MEKEMERAVMERVMVARVMVMVARVMVVVMMDRPMGCIWSFLAS